MYYHSDCRKTICNRAKIDRLKAKRTVDNSSGFSRGPGRPSYEVSSELHPVFTDSMGHTFRHIKLETRDDFVRMCLSDLE